MKPSNPDRALLQARQEERQWMAQLLHDSLCQSLASVGLLAKMVERQSAAGQDAAATWPDFNRGLATAGDDLRRLVEWLRTEEIPGAELVPRLEELAAGVGGAVHAAPDFPELSTMQATAVFSMAREVILGARRASGEGVITLWLGRAESGLHLSIYGAEALSNLRLVRRDWITLQAGLIGAVCTPEEDGVQILFPLEPPARA